jgi:hypothetical protein
VPFVNYGLMAICGVVFLLQAADPDGRLTFEFGMVPKRISAPGEPVVIEHSEVVRTRFGFEEIAARVEVPPSPIPPWMTMVSCIFLHGSLMHMLGNMWFLYIFGDNVEDRLGHIGFLLLYIGWGVIASLSHYYAQVDSPIPTIGASGAVAGVMGAYLLLYPHANVVTLVPFFYILQLMVVPAPIFLGLWFVLQLLQGTFSIGAAEATGVAWWAHVGGFVAGVAAAWLLGQSGQARPRVVVVRPGTDRRFHRMRSPWE